MSATPSRETVEAAKPMEVAQENCPNCQASIPVHSGFKTWCDQCGWNLEIPPQPPPINLFDKLYASISRRVSRELFDEMMSGQSLDVRLTPRLLLAFVVAGCVHLITLATFCLGLWLCIIAITTSQLFLLFAGLLICLVLVLLLLPRAPKQKLTAPLSRERFPALYELTDRIAQALNSQSVDGIMYDIRFNASFGQFGWRRKRLLTIGLPLLAIMDAQELVAVLGHEMAHNVNGDPARGFVLGAALDALEGWYTLLQVRHALLVLNIIALPIMVVIWLIANILIHLIWIDGQRAEYLADLLAARMSGTKTILAFLDKGPLYETFRNALTFAYIGRKGETFFADLRHRFARIPAREIERIRRVEQLTHSRIDRSHPPTAYRIAFLKKNPVDAPRVYLTASEATQLQRELAPLIEEVQREMFKLDEITFRQIFRLNW